MENNESEMTFWEKQEASGIPFDWKNDFPYEPLARDIFIEERFMRVGGECICTMCGKSYWRHPSYFKFGSTSRAEAGPDNQLELLMLCNGILGKS